MLMIFSLQNPQNNEPTKIDYRFKTSFVDYDDDLSELFAPTDDDSSKIGATPNDGKILSVSLLPLLNLKVSLLSDEEELKAQMMIFHNFLNDRE